MRRGNVAKVFSPNIACPKVGQGTLIPLNYQYALLCYRFRINAITEHNYWCVYNRICDEKKIEHLNSSQLKNLVKKGILGRIYAHLVSLENFTALLDRKAKAVAKTPA